MRSVLEICVVLAFVAVFIAVLPVDSAASPDLRDYFTLQGVAETGSINLVSSIYLAYRAFDALGETIILILSVSGIISILRKNDNE